MQRYKMTQVRNIPKAVKFKDGRQLEAEVHTSLPPLVRGVLRGHVRVYLAKVVWEYSIGPPAPKLCIKLKWWGEQSKGTLFRVPVEGGPSAKHTQNDCTTLAYYPVHSGVPQLKAYLNDMGPLQLQIGLGHMIEDSMLIGQSTISDLALLTPANPVKGFYSIINSDGIHLGKLQIRFSLELAKTSDPGKSSTSHDTHAPVPSSQEFVVGPGTKVSKHYDSPLGGGAVVNHSNSGSGMEQDRLGSSQATVSSKALTKSAIDVPTSGTKTHVPASTLGDPSGGPRSQQVEVISKLIERGQKLRDAMIQSLLQPSGFSDSKSNEDQEDIRYPSLNSKLLSMEVAQKDKRRHKQQKVTRKSSRKEKLPDRTPFTDQKIVDLVLGECHSDMSELNMSDFSLELSSEEEGVGLEEEISMNESDYPLYDGSLLQKLLYSEPGVPDGTGNTLTTTEPPHSASSEGQKHPQPQTSTSNLDAHPLTNAEVPDRSSAAEPHHLKPPISSTSPSNSHVSETAPSSQNRHSELESSSGRIDSWSTLSFFGRQDRALESTILQAIGMEKLTRLGRVTSARVTVECLQLDPSAMENLPLMQKKKMASKIPQPAVPSSRSTYFVEYRFPAAIPPSKAAPRAPSHEVMRVASKKMSSGSVKFSHRSVFPVAFSSSVIQQWWNSTLTFRIYCRPPNERMPFLVGKAVIPLRKLLGAHSLSTQCQLDVRACSLANAASSTGVSSEDPITGSLQVSLQLVAGKKQHWIPPKPATTTQRSPSAALAITEEREQREGLRSELEGQQQQQPIAVTLREKDLSPKDITQKTPAALQLLLLISEGVDITIPAATPDTQPLKDLAQPAFCQRGIPNCYLVCKLFCCDPHPQTPVQWASSSPQFAFKQVYPLYLTPTLLEKVCNNFTVIEVWHRTPGTSTDNELIGLVKLSLHQFYLAFSEEASASLCQKAELPVIAVDCYCPVVNPFSGTQHGYLAVLLALGTSSQVLLLQQQFAAGSYILQYPHQKKTSAMPASDHTQSRSGQAELRHAEDDRETIQDITGLTHHVFSLTVEGVRGLSVFSNTVWGEADCFVQYHFPALSEEDEEEGHTGAPNVHLQPYRTGTILCIPDPSFRQERLHPLPLSHDCPPQKVLIGACGSGRGGVPFELWRRFYYPNIRDQLVAKASLPVAKLCAMVTMQRTTEPNIQSFSLPLRLVTADDQDESGGLLDITVKYEASSESSTESHYIERSLERTHVNLSLGILRATGLKDAAALAASDHPVPLGFAAEVGVNTYARVSINSLLDRKHVTKTVARSFAPEFSHFFDLALPLSMKEGAPLAGSSRAKGNTTRLKRVSLAERLVGSCALVELWHQVPRRNLRIQPALAGGGGAFGRRLGPIFRDILLGYVEIPLLQLLSNHTGIHGWFPLLVPESGYDTPPTCDPDPPSSPRHAGGVELSLSFTSEDDRKLVMSHGLKMGWTAPRGCSTELISLLPSHAPGTEDKEEDCGSKQWKFDIEMSGLWVPLEAVTLPTTQEPAYRYCFIRYKLFETTPVVTTPKAVACSKDGMACYQLKHRAQFFTVDSPHIKWYLREETLAVQVWATVFAGKPKESRPKAEDTLLGFAYVPLSGALSDENEVCISGCYPMFKAGVDSLGGQMLRVKLKRTLAEGLREGEGENSIEVLDSSVEGGSGEHQSSAATPEGPRSETPPPIEDTHGIHSDPEVLKEMFEARIIIQQALHLPMITNCQQQDEYTPSAYVAVHPHPNVEKMVTPVVPNCHKPVWEYQCITHIPNLYLDLQGPGLEFQVWSKLQGSDQSQGDSYIGCAHVDLSPLGYGLSHVCGWYNITDFGGQIQGQLKVNVAPTQRINFSSKLLSTAVHVSMCKPDSIRSKHGSEHPSVLVSHMDKYDTEIDSETKSTSALFRQLRDNIQDLDRVHQTLQMKLQGVAEPIQSKDDDSLPTDSQKTPALKLPHFSTSSTVTSLLEPLTGWTTNETTEPHHVPLLHQIALSEKRQIMPPEPPTNRETVQTAMAGSTDLLSTSPLSQSPSSNRSSPDTQASINLESGRPLQPINSLTPTVPSEEGSDRSLNASLLSSSSPGESVSLTDVSDCSQDQSQSLLNSLPTEAQAVRHTLDSHSSITGESPLAVQGTVEHTEDEVSQQSLAVHDSGSSSTESENRSLSPSLPPTQQTIIPHQDTFATTETSHFPAQTTAPSLSGHLLTHFSLPQRSLSATVGPPRDHPPTTEDSQDVYATKSPQSAQNIKASEPSDDTLPRSACPSSTKNKLSHRLPMAIPPEIQLPNFFMSPQQLEETMRSLRATALSRHPPRQLFEPPRGGPGREGSGRKHSDTEPYAGAFRSVDEVSKYLDSRRTVSSERVPYRPKKLSTTETERIARIFLSNP